MKFNKQTKIILAAAVVLVIGIAYYASNKVELPEEVKEAQAQLPEKLDYNLHVKPILSDKCFFCHGPDKNSQKAGLELATFEGATRLLKNTKNKYAIVPGNVGKSEVFHRIVTNDKDIQMPPISSNLSLTPYEKAVLIRWIDEGAEYKPHWALIKPEAKELPKVKNEKWAKNPIDHFVLAKMEEKGLQPAPEADKELLIRRVTLDLTGLPPTLEEIDAFLADRSPNAYEKMVDRLLKSKHYGEKMSIDWLDVARYADTHGYTVDRYRPMWPYRDWVVNAFNNNMPFDQFITWQMAGDLLPNPTREQKIATAFNRNHSQNMEGGIVNEEFRVEYVADRTNTLGTAFLGLTMECSRCHDHKYDPISQKDYFSTFAFFNNIDESGEISWDDAMPVPTMMLTTSKCDSLLKFIDSKIAHSEKTIKAIEQQEKAQADAWKASNANVDLKKDLLAHFTFDKLENGKFNSSVSKDNATLADAVLADGLAGKAFKTNGDDILYFGKLGAFNRSTPFSISTWIKIPKDLHKGVVFHDGNGDLLYNYRGYYLNIRDDKAELLMAHTWPYNNIIKISNIVLPKEKWLHLTMTYDGSGKAKGLKLYVDGKESAMTVEKDNLYKDIVLVNGESGLRLGADWRGVGFKNGLFDELRVYKRELTAAEALAIQRIHAPNQQAAPSEALNSYYFRNISKNYQTQLVELQKLRETRTKVEDTIPEIMVMEEMKKPRPAYILKRGSYDAHGEQVQPDVPASVLPFPKEYPKNRLGLAKWLLHPDHPLFSRVIVNRYWQTYFGAGIHRMTNNFGNQGGLPSHPELLDWLAVQFRTSKWDVKALQRLIVTSATYRQSSKATPDKLAKDIENIYLSRGPSFRMSAEMIRDHALASSGLLSTKMGGPSVKPYQPEGLWAVNNAVYNQGKGEDLYRRSLYTFWKRTNPPPSMGTFDAPSRSYCIVQRQKTSTPLQALILLNDPQFMEASRVTAEKAILKIANENERINYIFRLLTARKPSDKETSILAQLYANNYKLFKANPKKMKGWITAGEHKTTGIKDPVALGALTIVTSTIMNSDAFITKR